jgi:hypothetical protein
MVTIPSLAHKNLTIKRAIQGIIKIGNKYSSPHSRQGQGYDQEVGANTQKLQNFFCDCTGREENLHLTRDRDRAYARGSSLDDAGPAGR